MRNLAKTILKIISKKHYLHYRAHKALISENNSFLYTTGWMNSLREKKPVDINGKQVPWMNYAIINFLEERLNKNLRVFEYGSGFSTKFYADKTKSVTSVEYDKYWHDFLKPDLPDNASLILEENYENSDYYQSILSNEEKFDVAIIDGRSRVNCLKACVEALPEHGVIILDDSHREKYTSGIDYARDFGFRAIHFTGIKGTSNTLERSTVLYKDNNCFEI